MSTHPLQRYRNTLNPANENESREALDDFDESFAMNALTVLVGIYLLVTVLLLRAGYYLARRIPMLNRPGMSPAGDFLRPTSARRD